MLLSFVQMDVGFGGPLLPPPSESGDKFFGQGSPSRFFFVPPGRHRNSRCLKIFIGGFAWRGWFLSDDLLHQARLSGYVV